MSLTGRVLCLSALMLMACEPKQEGEDSNAGETEGYTCPMDLAPQGDCPAVGETCGHGDFECSCVCGCDSPNPSGPGFWQCEYARDNLLQLDDGISITIDCGANTVAGVGTFTLDNVDAHTAVEVTLGPIPYSLWLYGDGLEMGSCGVCADGCEMPAASVEAGATGSLAWSFGPATCSQIPQLCDYCGGTATLLVRQYVVGDGLTSNDTILFENIPVECP